MLWSDFHSGATASGFHRDSQDECASPTLADCFLANTFNACRQLWWLLLGGEVVPYVSRLFPTPKKLEMSHPLSESTAVELKNMMAHNFQRNESLDHSCSIAGPSVLIPHPDRSRGDMCPGALSLHKAEDGAIGRVRFPGGRVLPNQWAAIAQIATELGDGSIHITTRGNMQFRGVQDETGFALAVEQAGFLPSKQHDKIRNILASPLSPELWEITDCLDNALLDNDVVAGLSGRTLFGIDAGTGDIYSHRPDFGVLLTEAGYQLILAGQLQELLVTEKSEIAPALVTAAQLWQQLRGASWRMQENPEVVAAIIKEIRQQPSIVVAAPPALQQNPQTLSRPIGWIDQGHDAAKPTVALAAGLRFGFFSAQVAKMLSAIGKPTSITPWASLVIHDLDESEAEAVLRVLAPMGLIFDAASPWLRITACTGLPGCAKAHSRTHDDAIAMIQSASTPDGLVHFSGCERRCGHPLLRHTEYVAVADGEYEVAIR